METKLDDNRIGNIITHYNISTFSSSLCPKIHGPRLQHSAPHRPQEQVLLYMPTNACHLVLIRVGLMPEHIAGVVLQALGSCVPEAQEFGFGFRQSSEVFGARRLSPKKE